MPVVKVFDKPCFSIDEALETAKKSSIDGDKYVVWTNKSITKINLCCAGIWISSWLSYHQLLLNHQQLPIIQ